MIQHFDEIRQIATVCFTIKVRKKKGKQRLKLDLAKQVHQLAGRAGHHGMLLCRTQ